MPGIIAQAWANKDRLKLTLTQVRQRLMQHLTQRAKRPPGQRTNYIPIMIGEPGIGKSTTLAIMAADLGWDFQRWDVNTQGFEDITGLPTITEHEIDGHKQQVATFAKAAFVPGAVWKKDRFTLGEIGELPTAPPNVQNILREMIDGQLNGEALDPKCMYVATGNPPEARFTTGSMIDDAVEDRLDPYIVIPTGDELLDVWSRIMYNTIYQFLMLNKSLIDDTISPRHWMVIAEKVQNLMQVGEQAEVILQDVRTAFAAHQNVLPMLLEFLKHGNDPYKLPILGRDYLYADEEAMTGFDDRLTYWFKQNNRGFVGHTKNDIIRGLNTLTAADQEHHETIVKNVVHFLIVLVEGKCNDMAKSLLEVAYSKEALVDPMLEQLADTPALDKMAEAYGRYETRKKELTQGDSGGREKRRAAKT